MNAWGGALSVACRWSGVAFLVSIVAIVTLQIIARYFFGNALIWPEEMSVFLLIYIVFVGAVYNTQSDSHIRVAYFSDRLPRHIRFAVMLAAHVLLLVHLVVLVWSMVPLSEALSISRSPALEWPMLIFFAVVPLSAGLMLIFYVLSTIALVRTWAASASAKGTAP